MLLPGRIIGDGSCSHQVRQAADALTGGSGGAAAHAQHTTSSLHVLVDNTGVTGSDLELPADSVDAGADDVTMPTRTSLKEFNVLILSSVLPNCVWTWRGGRKETNSEEDSDL